MKHRSSIPHSMAFTTETPSTSLRLDSAFRTEAIEALKPYLDAVNLVAMPKPKAGRTLKNFVEEWKRNVAATLKPSTVRAAQSHLRTHILPAMGDLSLTAISTRNVQAFISALAAKGLTRKSCDNV